MSANGHRTALRTCPLCEATCGLEITLDRDEVVSIRGDRDDDLLILGANPLASNGSLMTAPDMRGRLRAIRSRGGKVVVIDPRRSRTAEEADEHHFIRPGTDAHLLFALVHVLFEEGLADPGERLAAI